MFPGFYNLGEFSVKKFDGHNDEVSLFTYSKKYFKHYSFFLSFFLLNLLLLIIYFEVKTQSTSVLMFSEIVKSHRHFSFGNTLSIIKN